MTFFQIAKATFCCWHPKMHRLTILIFAWIGTNFLGAAEPAQPPTREQILAFLATDTATAQGPSTAEQLGPVLDALERLATKTPDVALVTALLCYQKGHPGSEDPRPAVAMGRLYWAQPKAFLAAFRALDGPSQRMLMPYVEFGWKQCIRGKIKSGRHFQQLQQDIDRLSASMINAR